MKHSATGHYIRRNQGSKIPRHIMVVDTETEYKTREGKEHHRMKIAWSVFARLDTEGKIEVETWRYFDKRYALCEHISNMAIFAGQLTLVGNNIFFDLQAMGFFKFMPEMGWKLNFIYENGMTYILIIENERSRIKAISLTNYFQASVKDLGSMIGNPKIEVDFDSATEEQLSVYCFRDTEITFDALIKYINFVHENKLGNFALTRASQSMKGYRHRFMKEKLLYHTDPEITDLERAAYFGGRTECFRTGEIEGGPFIDLDINSLYPYIMKTKKMPARVFDYYDDPTMQDLIDGIKRHGCIAEVNIDTDRPVYPYREGAKLLFPVGQFTTSICTESIKNGIERNEIKGVKRLALYDMEYIFGEYIDYFYEIRMQARKENNTIVDRMAKLFMNSLYGKFAQLKETIIIEKEIEGNEYSRMEVYDAITGEQQIITKLFGRLTVTRGREPIEGSIFSIPAHVTEYARNLLWSIMANTGTDKILYCDTDCIKIRKSDLPLVHYPIDAVSLGALKVEAEYSRLSIHGPKDYETDSFQRIKGVPKNSKRLPDGSFEYKQFGRQLSHMREGNCDDFIVKTVHKELERVYRKGRVDSRGFISPFVLPSDLRRMKVLKG